MTLFTEDDLGELIGKPVTESRGAMVERVVWGWLKPILDLEDRPDPVPDELFSWAVELGGIAHENPIGLSGKATGPFSEQFSGLRDRRETILKDVRQWAAAQGDDTAAAPGGSFPEAPCYPDPAW
ncbi:MAG TPA: hypothetical protein VLI04_22195 [Nocardioidaceae bacterium]|nr:hypothetical protein [Nocardioidaceae bacterium]